MPRAATARRLAWPIAPCLNTFATTGSTAHTTAVSGLTSGSSYTVYVRCVDALSNANTDDFVIAFSVASASATTSNFAGRREPLEPRTARQRHDLVEDPDAFVVDVLGAAGIAEPFEGSGRLARRARGSRRSGWSARDRAAKAVARS